MGAGRTSQEVRGLKHRVRDKEQCHTWSHLARGAWIETSPRNLEENCKLSHLARGAWIETLKAPEKGDQK